MRDSLQRSADGGVCGLKSRYSAWQEENSKLIAECLGVVYVYHIKISQNHDRLWHDAMKYVVLFVISMNRRKSWNYASLLPNLRAENQTFVPCD